MPTSPQTADEDIRLLDLLSGLGMAMAQSFQAQCLAAGEAREAADLALGFQRAARSVRQCLALKSRLQWDAERRARETGAEADDTRVAHAERRKAQVRLAVKRYVLEQHASFDADNLLSDLEERLDEDALYGVFAGQDDINRHIARMCEEMGVTCPAVEEDAAEVALAEAPPALGEVAAKPAEAVRSDLGEPTHPLHGTSSMAGATELVDPIGPDEPPRQSSA